MKIFTIANNKGGAGKTPVAYYLGLRWANQGKHVTLLDLDGQANLSDRVCPGLHYPSMAHVLQNEYSLRDALEFSTISPNLAIVPATDELYDIENELSGAGMFSLYNALNRDGLGDIIIIDTPPNLGTLTLSSIVATGLLNGWVIVPVKPETDSISGSKRIRHMVAEAHNIPNCKPRILGIIATQCRETTTHQKWLAELKRNDDMPLLGCSALRGGQHADYDLSKSYATIADTIWQKTGDTTS